jgi:hypothetical protein
MVGDVPASGNPSHQPLDDEDEDFNLSSADPDEVLALQVATSAPSRSLP